MFNIELAQWANNNTYLNTWFNSNDVSNSNLPDTGLDCISCGAIELMQNGSRSYIESLAEVIMPGIQIVMLSLMTLYIVYIGTKRMLSFIDWLEVLKEFSFLFIASVLVFIVGADGVTALYDFVLIVIGWLTNVAFSINQHEQIDTSSFILFAASLEKQILYLIYQVWDGLDGATIFRPDRYMLGFFLIIPYFIALLLITAQIAIGFFNIVLLCCLSFISMAVFGFSSGRGMMIATFKSLTSTIIVFFTLAVGMSFIVALAL